MFQAAIAFFILGLTTILLSANGMDVSIDIGKSLLFIFLVLSVIAFIASLAGGKWKE
jgi:hypothetical protein